MMVSKLVQNRLGMRWFGFIVMVFLTRRIGANDVIAEYDESVVHGLHITTTTLLGEPIKILKTIDLMLYTKAIQFNSTNSTREDKEDLQSLMYSAVRASGSSSTLTTWLGIGFNDDGSNIWMYPGNMSLCKYPLSLLHALLKH